MNCQLYPLSRSVSSRCDGRSNQKQVNMAILIRILSLCLVIPPSAHGITHNFINKTTPSISCCSGEITLDPTITTIGNNIAVPSLVPSRILLLLLLSVMVHLMVVLVSLLSPYPPHDQRLRLAKAHFMFALVSLVPWLFLPRLLRLVWMHFDIALVSLAPSTFPPLWPLLLVMHLMVALVFLVLLAFQIQFPLLESKYFLATSATGWLVVAIAH